MADLTGLATEVVVIVQKAQAPLLERMAAMEQVNRDLQARLQEMAGLRDRLVAVETKSAVVPSPAVSEPVDLTPVLERLAGVEARISVLGDVRDRVVTMETKAAVTQPVVTPTPVVEPVDVTPILERLAAAEARLDTLGDVRDRVVTIETKAAAPVEAPKPVDLSPVLARLDVLESRPWAPVETWSSLGTRIESLESKTAIPAVSADDVADIRDRVTTLETRTAGPSLTDMALVDVRKSLSDLQAESSSLRERVAVVEVRQPVPGPAGKDGAPGRDGANGIDGMGWEDLVVEPDGERAFTFKTIKGDRVKHAGTFTVPVQINRGVYQDGKTYERGDVVTWAGSQWHANETTSSKPGDGSKSWTLVVKKGRDGRDGVDAPRVPVVSVGTR